MLYLPLVIHTGYHNRDSLIHPTRAMQFLVGVRGKNETMAIGGPWSPSLDGPNPASDPSVCIQCIVRGRYIYTHFSSIITPNSNISIF